MSLKESIDRVNTALENADKLTAKKLTTKDRKKMKSSTFCGPNRSFPVPDCKHVATAKTYLNRANFSASTKKKIAACINRKAKSLGCTPGKPAKVKGSLDVFDAELLQIAESEIFASTKLLVEASLKAEGGLDLDFDSCEDCGE